MRRYGIYDMTRGLTLALAAAAAGLGLWGAAHVGTQTTARFWIAMAIVAGAGFVLALVTHVGTWTKGLRLRVSPTTFVAAFLPVLVCVAWALLANQPGSGWEEARVQSWSSSLGILGVVHSVGLWRGVLAFAVGAMLALSLDGVPVPEPIEPAVADEPVAAERHWTRKRSQEVPSDTQVEEPVRG